MDRVKDGPVTSVMNSRWISFTSERYQLAGRGMTLVFVRAEDSEEGMREHGQGDPARPGRVAADLVLVQGRQALAGLEKLLDPPP